MAAYDIGADVPVGPDPLSELGQHNQHLRQEHDALYREACKTISAENDRLENQNAALRAQLAEHNDYFQRLPSVVPPPPQEASRPYQERVSYKV